MTTQQDVFNSMALQLLTDPMELARYANEDQLGGYHWDGRLAKWPMGSLFSEEGQVLYALIRKYKPQQIVEIGTLRGCSTAHMATALDVNVSGGEQAGHIWAIDVSANAGDLFPAHLKPYVTSVTGDGLAWLAGQEDESIDFLFEDSSHGEDMCASIAALCKTKLKPGGILVMHDAAHDFSIDGNGSKTPSPYGGYIRAGLTRALGNEFRTYLAEPSDCGFALWRKPIEIKSFTMTEISAMPDGGYEIGGYADKHSTPVDIKANIQEAYERLTEQAKTIGLKPTEPEWNLGIPVEPQMIDHEFISQSNLPFAEFDITEEQESNIIEDKPVEPPKKKRGRPSKKDKAE